MKFPRGLVSKFSKKLASLGLIVGSEGNISVKTRDDKIYITPTGVLKSELSPEEIVIVDLDGDLLEGKDPSSELPMHLSIYKKRPDVRAVIHAHPPYTLALSLAQFDFSSPILVEAEILLRDIVVIPFVVPGTDELPKVMEPHLEKTNVFILERHGAVTLGKDLSEAFNLMVILEEVSRVCWLAMAIKSNIRPLSSKELEKLRKAYS